MGVNSFPETVTRQRRGCDLNPDPFVRLLLLLLLLLFFSIPEVV